MEQKKRKLDESGADGSDLMYQQFMGILMTKMADVNFIFEDSVSSTVVKVPAHKDILSASSPVFDAMFNGPLKENGDVQIVDASPAAFEEFPLLFYGRNTKLTMDNIGVVLALIDKYNVTDCFAICAEFLTANVTCDNILWALHLSIKFHLDDLKNALKLKIQKHYALIADQLDFDDDGKLCGLLPSRNDLTENDLAEILPHIFSISKNVISNQSKRIDELKILANRAIFPICLTSTLPDTQHHLTNNETISFSLSGRMLLTEILTSIVCELAQIPNVNGALSFSPVIDYATFDMSIVKQSGPGSQLVYKLRIESNSIHGNKYVKLMTPVEIEPNILYTIKLAKLMNDFRFGAGR